VIPTPSTWLSASSSAANPVPDVNPSASALPGGAALQTLIDGLAFYTLAVAVAVLIGGAAAWAVGSNTGNLEWATNGKRATVVAACAAVLVGAASVLVRFFYALGTQVR
jgi:hypothetical protein